MSVDSDDCCFRILGPVQVVTSRGPLAFARRQHLDLLALLLMHAERVLTVEQIIDAMWGESVPRTASTQIKNMVSALRATLVDGARALAVVDRQPAGYRLRIIQGQLDLARFTALLGQARGATHPRPDPDAVVRALRRALRLWRGTRALAGVRAAFADAARVHLEEQRASALEALFNAELDRGNHAGIVAELTDAAAEHPGRERLVAQLMIALYRSGRPTDALGVYRRARQTLADEYALEPGAPLRDLERLILLGDESLDSPVARSTAPIEPDVPVDPPLPKPAQLPPDVRGFAGRTVELARLDALVSDLEHQPSTVVISALMGTAGIGKTALAVHWAHRVAGRFPDGQLYVNLRGFDQSGGSMTAGEAVRGFLDALGIPAARIPAGLDAQAALYRSLVAGRRMLVVLDNAESTEQVRPLLPGKPGCLVLVTSRNRLAGLVSGAGAEPVTLDLLTADEARDLLVARLGTARTTAERQATDDIVRSCARLPLALAMVAARAAIHPSFPLAMLSAELRDARGGLDVFSGHDPGGDVRTVFSWSYRRLGADAARLFRLLGLHPGPDVSAAAAASLAGCPPAHVHPLLTELTSAHLIAEHSPGRFAFHDLLRAYAVELGGTADTEAEQRAAVRRMIDHYLHTADTAASRLYPHRYQIDLLPADPSVTSEAIADHPRASAWFTAEHPVLIAIVKRAAAADLGTHAWQLASTITPFLNRRGLWHDWADIQQTAQAVAERLGDPVGQAHAHSGLGLACTALRDYDRARTQLRRALDLFGELDDAIGQAYAYHRMSSVDAGQGQIREALGQVERALDLYRAAGHRAGQAQVLNTIGWYHAQLGQSRDALAYCEEAVALHRELGDAQGAAHTLDSLGYAHHLLGDHRRAAGYYRQSAQMLREFGDHYYEAIALTHLGDAHGAAGEVELAREAWREALRILHALRHPDAEQVEAKVRALGSSRLVARVTPAAALAPLDRSDATRHPSPTAV